MIINKVGDTFSYDGVTYRIGERIIGTEESEYAGLNGTIFEIRDGEDKETENDTPDIYCSFEPPVLPGDIKELEKTFSELYQEEKHLEDIALDFVILAPDMIVIPEQPQKSIKVYVLTEDWSVKRNQGSLSYAYGTLLEAKAQLNHLLTQEIQKGSLSDWIDRKDYETDISELSYEGWIDGDYIESHYAVSIDVFEMGLMPFLIGNIGRFYMDNCRYEDFASQVAQWDEVNRLSEQEYRRFLQDKRIPELIEKKLGDYYWESYWEAVSEAAHILLNEYLDRNAHCEEENTIKNNT